MQGTDAGVRVPGAFGMVFVEDFGQAARVFSQMHQRYGAVFDEGDWFAVALHAHHDIQAGLAYIPQGFLFFRIDHIDDRTGQAQVAHQVGQRRQAFDQRRFVVAGEFHQQDGFRGADQRFFNHRTEG
ncbi:hypothetical protein D3C81_1749750 [compost metagenome]